MGGAGRLRELVDRFYDHMASLPEARDILALHPPDLTGSRDKLYWFLSGLFGGPPLYVERRGHPMLRRRHLVVSIGPRERDQWLLCMSRAMDDLSFDGMLRQQLDQYFRNTAEHMRNDQ
ncbi:MAG: group II truncated hemoglobin [Chromatiales bacterium]|nr:group II truncated hemoglobin [Chromatiales bacterium]